MNKSKSNVKNFFDYKDTDCEITIGGVPIEEVDNPDYSLIPKIASMSMDLYMKSPKMFTSEFNKMIKKIKLNIKIKETYKTKEARKRIYSAMSLFDEIVKKQSYNKAYEIASKHYEIPEEYLRSIIGTRNNLSRSYLKMKENQIKINF